MKNNLRTLYCISVVCDRNFLRPPDFLHPFYGQIAQIPQILTEAHFKKKYFLITLQSNYNNLSVSDRNLLRKML